MFFAKSPHRPAVAALIVGLFLFAAESRGQQESDTPPRHFDSPAANSLARGPSGMFEIGLGYNYIHDDLASPYPEDLHGVDLSAFVNINSWLSLGGDFMANFGKTTFFGFDLETERYVYVFGPRVSIWPTKRVRIFAELLAGGAHATAELKAGRFSRSASDDGLALALGFGADWRFTDHFSWRVLQFDYLPTNLGGDWLNTWRLSTGIVYTFGQRK